MNTRKISIKRSDEISMLEGCKRGDRLAQSKLYRQYYGKMLPMCMRYTANRSEAEDVLNRAFLKVFNSFDQYQDQGNLGGWIAKIVFNTTIDYVRSNTRYQQTMDFEVERDTAIPPKILEKLVAEDLYKAIQQLPSNTRSVFSLYVLDGYKHHEIAALLEIPENTSKWHLAKARKTLQQLLQNYDWAKIAV